MCSGCPSVQACCYKHTACLLSLVGLFTVFTDLLQHANLFLICTTLYYTTALCFGVTFCCSLFFSFKNYCIAGFCWPKVRKWFCLYFIYSRVWHSSFFLTSVNVFIASSLCLRRSFKMCVFIFEVVVHWLPVFSTFCLLASLLGWHQTLYLYALSNSKIVIASYTLDKTSHFNGWVCIIMMIIHFILMIETNISIS